MGREQRLNDLIDTESFLKKTPMSLSMRTTKASAKVKAYQAREIDRRADWLVGIFGCPESREFYCKCAIHIPWGRVTELVELALRPRIIKKAAYFGRLAKTEMINLGVA